MLADSRISDQLDPGEEEGEDVKEGKEVEQRVPATTMHLKVHVYQWPRRNTQ